MIHTWLIIKSIELLLITDINIKIKEYVENAYLFSI